MRKLAIYFQPLSFVALILGASLVSSCSPEEEKAESETLKELERGAEGSEGADIANEIFKKQEEYKEKALEERQSLQEERKLMSESFAHTSPGMKRR